MGLNSPSPPKSHVLDPEADTRASSASRSPSLEKTPLDLPSADSSRFSSESKYEPVPSASNGGAKNDASAASSSSSSAASSAASSSSSADGDDSDDSSDTMCCSVPRGKLPLMSDEMWPLSKEGAGAAWKRELLSGITVALAQVPEAVAFAFVAGVPPIVGLQAAWINGFFASLFGDRPGMITGATGALAVVLPQLVEDEGLEYLFYAVIFQGLIQLLAGALKLGRFVSMIPHPVMIGFCDGLAIIIGFSQFTSFKKCIKGTAMYDACLAKKAVHAPAGGRALGGSYGVFTDGGAWLPGEDLLWMTFLIAATMATVHWLPKLTKAVPSSMAAIGVAMALEHGLLRGLLDKETRLVEDVASVEGEFPMPIFFDSEYSLPSPMEAFGVVLPYSLILAFIGLVESLMTQQLLNEMTGSKGCPSRECVGQGIGNVVSGILGGMGGCAMIGQSMINVKSGGVTRISSISAALFLLVVIMFAYPIINLIPIAGLVGVMFMVVIHTFEWFSLKLIFTSLLPKTARDSLSLKAIKVRRVDCVVIILVTVVTVFTDLAMAVLVGVIVSALSFAWEKGSSVSLKTFVSPDGKLLADHLDVTDPESGVVLRRVYHIEGSLFFASTQRFLNLFDPALDPEHVELHFHNSEICDFSGIEALNSLAEKYYEQGKRLHLKNIVCPNTLRVMGKAQGLLSEELRYNLEEGVAEDVDLLNPKPTLRVLGVGHHLNVTEPETLMGLNAIPSAAIAPLDEEAEKK